MLSETISPKRPPSVVVDVRRLHSRGPKRSESPHVDFYKRGLAPLLCWVAVLGLLTGCATDPKPHPPATRTFDFRQDTFAYPNELTWEYYHDTNGVWTSRRREPKPTYSLHCVVVARSARQFYDFASFDPRQPVVDESTYRRLVREVIGTNPRRISTAEKVVIPGYANLREFSEAHETLLKAECGSAWQSYTQRGHWRMIFPFTRHQQERTATQLLKELKTRHPPIVHLVRFPQLTINHAMLVFDSLESEKETRFLTYDPNQPDAPAALSFNRQTRTFILPANKYFPGGRVDVYEIYHRWDY